MSEETKKLSLEPYKGTRDFYPEDQFVQNYIFSVWRKVVESYGYVEYNASILEETALYKAKSGEEIVNDQTYSFTDRGGRDVTIRPEMTPTVARMVAQKRKELSFPLRWYSIPNLFRYERPQRGRLREHWQLNVDLFGVDGIEADMEIISVSYQLMKDFGAKDDQFEIRLNSRKFLNFLMNDFLRLSSEESYQITKLLDRMHKMSGEDFSAQAQAILGNDTRFNALMTVINSQSLENLPETVRNHESAQELMVFREKLELLGIRNTRFEISLVRGFDYYTGIVFEVFDTSQENNRSIFGGGRYDNLVGMFGVEKVSGIGFGKGDVVIRDFLETRGLLPEYKSLVNLYICPFDRGYIEYCNKFAAELRNAGLNVAVDFTDRKLSSKVKTADRERIPWVLVIGDQETKSKIFRIKNLKEGKEYEVRREEILSLIK